MNQLTMYICYLMVVYAQTREIAFSPNSEYLFMTTRRVGNEMGGVVIFSSLNLNVEGHIWGHTDACVNIAIDPTQKRMAVSGADSLVTLWELEDLICYRTLSEFEYAHMIHHNLYLMRLSYHFECTV